jgi:hypothetical protein
MPQTSSTVEMQGEGKSGLSSICSDAASRFYAKSWLFMYTTLAGWLSQELQHCCCRVKGADKGADWKPIKPGSLLLPLLAADSVGKVSGRVADRTSGRGPDVTAVALCKTVEACGVLGLRFGFLSD